MLWSGAEIERQRIFDCDYCKRSGLIDRRNCFWFDDEIQSVEISQDVYDDSKNLVYLKGQILNVDSEELCSDVLISIMDVCKNASPLEILRRYLNKVCPKSLITLEIDHLITLEMFAKEYHISPFGNAGLYDYPQRFVNIFSVIVGTRERVKLEELKNMQTKRGP